MACAACSNELDHCHGTLIVHATTEVECTDETCVELDAVRHALVVDCESLTGGCGCTPLEQPVGALQAS